MIDHQTRQLRHPRQRPATGAATPVAAATAAATSVPAQPRHEREIESAPAPGLDIERLERQLSERIRAELLEQIRVEAEAARELGRQRGLREGRDTGQEEARQALAAEMNRLRAVVDSLTRAVDAGIRNQEALAVGVAFEAVCRILGDTLVTAEGVAAQVRAVTERVAGSERLLVRLHPDDLALLQAAGQATTSLDHHASVAWTADPRVGIGGCILETDGSGVDARLETQMEKLRACLLETRGGVTP